MKRSINKFLSTALVVALGMLAAFPMTARAAYSVSTELELRNDIATLTSSATPDTIEITSSITLSAPLALAAGADITITGTGTVDPLIYTNGHTLTVENGGILTVLYTAVGGGDGIRVNGGAIIVESGGILTLKNASGIGINVIVGAVTVNGNLKVENTGTSQGIVTNGVFTVASGGILTVNSSLDGTSIRNQQGGTFNNYGTINKTKGLLNNESSTFNNYGTINNGMANNVATLSTIANQSNSTFNNYGTINNNGWFINNSPLNNYAGGVINNDSGTFYNRFATITNYAGGVIDNSNGTFDNSIGTINNYVGGVLINIAGGIINNITAPAITSANGYTCAAGTGGSFQVTATGTPSAFTYSLTGQPAGVSINSNTGLITVAKTVAAGTYSFTVGADNGFNPPASQTFTLTVSTPAPPPSGGGGVGGGGGGGGRWNPPNPVTQEKPAPAQTAPFPAQGTAQKRLSAYVKDTLKGKVAFRVNKGDGFTLLGLAENGKALLIQQGERKGYIAPRDFKATFAAPLKATATAKKAGVYTVQQGGKLKRIGYYPLGTLIGISGVDGGYLISKQASVAYWLKSGEWRISAINN